MSDQDGFAALRSATTGQKQRVSEDRIQTFLSRQPELARRAFSVVIDNGALIAGASSGTVMFDLDVGGQSREPFVLKYDLKGAFFKQYALAPQFHIMRALAREGLPVPEALWLDEAGEMTGSPALIMRRVAGRAPSMKPFNEGLLTEASSDQRRQMMFDALRLLARLHSVDSNKLQLLAARGQGEHFLDREIHWTSTELLAGLSPVQAGDERAHLHADMLHTLLKTADWLKRNAPRRRMPEIAHGDASMSNILFTQDCRIAALLDWELCHHGLGEADLAYFLFASETTRQMAGDRGVEVPADTDLIRVYREARGRLDDWEYAQVLAAWRGSVWSSIGLKRMPRELWSLEARLWTFQKERLAKLTN